MRISKIDRTVVRNHGYPKDNFSIRERHNERKNEVYSNPDIVLEQSHLNINFKKCEGTYAQTFNSLLESGAISTRGLKPDADVFGELVFDVNTNYFDEHGGYEYAKTFFAEAYKMAVAEVGGEDYILSAVMHADERNKSLSEDLGRDVFHYHLHVVYIPIVEKEIRYSKRSKDKSLVGTVKEVIHQVSHSKKWASIKATDECGEVIRNESGKAVLIPSYSLLQDRFFEHMRASGFRDFERGVRGSTTAHLSVLDYKLQQDKQRLAEIEKMAAVSQKELSAISRDLTVSRQVNKTFHDIENAGKKTLFGKVELPEKEYREVIELAKEALGTRGEAERTKRKLNETESRLFSVQSSYEQLREQTADFRQAIKLAPERVKEVFTDIFKQEREHRELSRQTKSTVKHNSREHYRNR